MIEDSQSKLASAIRLQQTMKLLTIAFIGAYALLGLFFYFVSSGQDTTASEPWFSTLLPVVIASFLLFYVVLGIQASRLGKSVVIWVAGAAMTCPIGPVLFYFWARKDTKLACRRLMPAERSS